MVSGVQVWYNSPLYLIIQWRGGAVTKCTYRCNQQLHRHFSITTASSRHERATQPLPRHTLTVNLALAEGNNMNPIDSSNWYADRHEAFRDLSLEELGISHSEVPSSASPLVINNTVVNQPDSSTIRRGRPRSTTFCVARPEPCFIARIRPQPRTTIREYLDFVRYGHYSTVNRQRPCQQLSQEPPVRHRTQPQVHQQPIQQIGQRPYQPVHVQRYYRRHSFHDLESAQPWDRSPFESQPTVANPTGFGYHF